MGSCGASKRDANINEPSLYRKISINPAQFVFQSKSRFSQFYKIGKKLGGGIPLFCLIFLLRQFLAERRKRNIKKPIGAYGEVYVCYHRQAGFPRAVKVLQKVAINESEKERFLREISILKIMDHPNIVRLYETYADSKRYYLVTEYSLFIFDPTVPPNYYQRSIDFVREANCLTDSRRRKLYPNVRLRTL